MWVVVGLLFLLSGIIYLSKEIKFIKRNNDLFIISYARLIYSCSCGFFGAMLCFLYAFRGVEMRLSTLIIMDYDNEALINLFIFWMLSVIGYCFLCIGYKIVGTKRIVLSSSNQLRRRLLSDNQVYIVALSCFLIGLIGLLIWTSDMGGIFQYIRLASAIRGDYQNVFGNTHMAYRQIARILLPATYLFFFLAIKRNNAKRLYKISFIIAFVFAVFYLLCNDGRLTIAMFFGVLVIGKLRYGRNEGTDIKKQFMKLAFLIVLASILLAKLDDITYYIRNHAFRVGESQEKVGIFETLMSEFTYIYKSGITAVANCFPNGRLMILDDILFGISAYLPGGISLGDHIRVSLLNTVLCTNNAVNQAGSIPCDIIAYSLYSLSYLGIVIIPFGVGAVIRFVENSFYRKKHNPLEQTLYAGMILTFLRLITYCDTYDFLTSIFPYIFLWVLAYFASIMFKNKNRGMNTR